MLKVGRLKSTMQGKNPWQRLQQMEISGALYNRDYLCSMEWTFDLDSLPGVAANFWQHAAQHKVFAFHGDMGAGKTTFIHALCDALGVTSTVGSPTFPIINQYDAPNGPVFHLDLYRLKDEEEAIQAGVEDALYSGATCLVEWPDRAPAIFPDDTVHVHIKAINTGTRNVTIR
jgi:tRNA threonylcarbamoyladenosine biosynthesis protein TsaE